MLTWCLCLPETEKQLIVYDQIVKLLRDAGGLHGNDLKAKEFIDNEDEFWLQYPHVVSTKSKHM